MPLSCLHSRLLQHLVEPVRVVRLCMHVGFPRNMRRMIVCNLQTMSLMTLYLQTRYVLTQYLLTLYSLTQYLLSRYLLYWQYISWPCNG